MARIAFFVDGFNLYHSIARVPRLRPYKWLDINKLCRSFVSPRDEVVDVYYFTALAHWNPDKVRRHRTFIRALRTTGVQPVYGVFRVVDKKCRADCKKWYKTFEEKRTDVNIALYLVAGAINDAYDTAIIVSGDSDLLPAVRTILTTFPSKSVGVIFPFMRTSFELRNEVNFYSRIRERHLRQARFPDVITIGADESIVCPDEWRDEREDSKAV
jgi:uncharacterized LabA/DUF88 family protein